MSCNITKRASLFTFLLQPSERVERERKNKDATGIIATWGHGTSNSGRE